MMVHRIFGRGVAGKCHQNLLSSHYTLESSEKAETRTCGETVGGDPARAATAGVQRRDPLLGSNKHRWETPGRTHSNSNGSQHLNGEAMSDEMGTVTVLNREKVIPKGKAGCGV